MGQRLAMALMLALAAFAASGCTTTRSSLDPPRFNFAGETTFSLPAAEIRFENAYVPSPTAHNIDGLYRVTPADIARAWVRDRVRLTGKTGYVLVRILESSVTENMLPTEYGFFGSIAGEQNREFTARLKIDIFVHASATDKTPGRVSAEASGSRTFRAVGPGQSEADYYALLESLAPDFDGALATQMTAYVVGL